MTKTGLNQNINSTNDLMRKLNLNSKIIKKKELNFLKRNGYLIIRKNKY